MEDFDLRKYLAEGKLLKENYTEPEYGSLFAVDVDFGSLSNGDFPDEIREKLPNSNREKNYVRFDPRYYNEEEDDYLSLDDTDDRRYEKIDNLDFWGIWDPDTMKIWHPENKDDGFDEYEPGSNRTYYFDTEKEIIDFGGVHKFELENARNRNK